MSDEGSGNNGQSDHQPNSTDNDSNSATKNEQDGENKPSVSSPTAPVVNVTVDSHNSQHETPQKKRDWYDKWTLVFHGGTFIGAVLAVVAAGFAAKFTWNEVQETRRTLDISQRAWLAPSDLVNKEGDFEVGKPHEIQLLFRNTGQTPARNTNLLYRPFVVLNDDLKRDGFVERRVRELIGNRDCKDVPSREDGYVVFPTSGPPETARVLVEEEWKPELIARRKYLIVAGCFAYDTLGKEPGHTYFCLFLDHRADKSSKNWTGTRCLRFKEYAD